MRLCKGCLRLLSYVIDKPNNDLILRILEIAEFIFME